MIHTVVADPISMEVLTEAEGMRLLRDTMATWYLRLMERYGRSTRSELLGDALTAQEVRERYIAMHTGAVPFYDREVELAADYRPRSVVRPEDVWRPVAEIQTVTTAEHGPRGVCKPSGPPGTSAGFSKEILNRG